MTPDQEDTMDPNELRTDLIRRGPGKGRRVRITHLPTGLAVEGDLDYNEAVVAACEDLRKKLQRKIEES